MYILRTYLWLYDIIISFFFFIFLFSCYKIHQVFKFLSYFFLYCYVSAIFFSCCCGSCFRVRVLISYKYGRVVVENSCMNWLQMFSISALTKFGINCLQIVPISLYWVINLSYFVVKILMSTYQVPFNMRNFDHSVRFIIESFVVREGSNVIIFLSFWCTVPYSHYVDYNFREWWIFLENSKERHG